MAHAGQEIALGLAGGLGFLGGELQFAVVAAQLVEGDAQLARRLRDLLFQRQLVVGHGLPR